MSEATIATITNITLNQNVTINGTSEPCHFIEFDSTLSEKVIPGDSTGAPAARMFFPQIASRESRATVPPVDLVSGYSSAPEIMEINRTGSVVNGVPAWGIAIARWTNTPTPAIAIGDEVIFIGNTNTVPTQAQIITGCTNAQIQSAIVDYRKYTTPALYDIWLNTRQPNFDGNIVFDGDNTFNGINTFTDNNVFTGDNDFSGGEQTFNNIVVSTLNGSTPELSKLTTSIVDYNVLTSDYTVVLGSSTIADRTFTLFPISGNNGRKLTFINNSSFYLTIDGNGGETINGVPTITIAPGETLPIIAGQTQWKIYGKSKVLIQKGSVSLATDIQIVKQMDSAYPNYELHLSNIVPDTASTFLGLRVSATGGPPFDNTGGGYPNSINGTGHTANQPGGGNVNLIYLTLQVAGWYLNTGATHGYTGIVTIQNPSNTTHTKKIESSGTYYNNSSEVTNVQGSGFRNNTSIVNALQIFAGTGNITGDYRFYGVL